jgi:hypothetical protein
MPYVPYGQDSTDYSVLLATNSSFDIRDMSVLANTVTLSASDTAFALLQSGTHFIAGNTIGIADADSAVGEMSFANFEVLGVMQYYGYLNQTRRVYKTPDSGTHRVDYLDHMNGVRPDSGETAEITIICGGDTLTLNDGNNLKLSATWTPGAGDTLTLVYDGTNWYETGRSDN